LLEEDAYLHLDQVAEAEEGLIVLLADSRLLETTPAAETSILNALALVTDWC
jgi:hypothetical protein